MSDYNCLRLIHFDRKYPPTRNKFSANNNVIGLEMSGIYLLSIASSRF
jgi:hypothetical protein